MRSIISRLMVQQIRTLILAWPHPTITWEAVRSAVLQNPSIAQFLSPLTAAGRAALNSMIDTQAQIIAYIDDYKLLMSATLLVIPLLIAFRKPPPGQSGEAVLVD